MTPKKVLALNPFHGGSHKAFLDGWQKRSIHQWTTLTLMDSYWKWKLQYAAVEFSTQVNELYKKGERWDVIFCTSMMNVADFRAMTPNLQNIPLVVYFHENQLTYPESDHMKFDLSLCMVNIKSALVADQVWFNSGFHRDDFLSETEKILLSKPSDTSSVVKEIREKSAIQYQAIDEDFFCSRKASEKSPVKIVWAARWELDKNPELLFKALRHLVNSEIDFELFFLGEEMHTTLDCIEQGRQEFGKNIKEFGYLKSRDEYKRVLQTADVFVSTANHEFFGISVVEAVAAGCRPIIPNHQVYPEVLEGFENNFYKPGSAKGLVEKILSTKGNNPALSKKYFWDKRSHELDKALADL